ncbi:MAG: hypothetical protein FJY75_08265 [Candidatus Eisenbacteria bacterium]|uniref:FlgD/Vpr Ig-like domain-containing protein n=1 Tax=Eiseniibacteriota bacterium TaxID=2212470 RepID=A0A938BR05_UNCEI|nr:hypothetical protein [Candidatus Eisenbacteria bacterium]
MPTPSPPLPSPPAPAAASRPALRSPLRFAWLCGLLLAGAPPAAPDPPPFCDEIYLFIATSEYQPTAGAFSLMDVQPPWSHADNYGILSGDAIPYGYRGFVYLLDRAQGRIQVLDPRQDFALLRQFSVGAASNPHDICFLSEERAFVTRYDSTELWEIDPSTGAHTGTIDLAIFADADGLPEMNALAVHGNRLFVTLQRLDRDYGWVPVPPSLLAVVDLDTNTLLDMDPDTPGVQGLPLAGTNPNSGIVVDPRTGHFLIGQAGSYYALDGGVERFDPAAGQSLGLVIDEGALGGNIDHWSTADGLTGYAIVLGASWQTAIVEFDLVASTVTGPLIASPVWAFSHFLIDPPRNQMFVCDRTYANPGVRVCDLVGRVELTTTPIRVGLYPYWLLEMRGPAAGLPDGGASGAPPALRALPQPAAGEVSLRFRTGLPGAATLEILDVAGRRVAAPGARALGAGAHEWLWDGRAADGRPAPAGAYWARLRTVEGTAATRICRLP